MKTPAGKLDSRETFAVMTPALATVPIALTPEIYANLESEFDDFRGHWLFSRHAFSSAWQGWERHPAGDEIVFLLSGDVEMVLETGAGESVLRLSRPGEYCIVPKNTWHTARTKAPCEMLFITPGEGTEHRPVGA